MNKKFTFNQVINILNSFWHENGCILLQPTDYKVGAATFHPLTFTKALNKNSWKAAYTQLSRRPSDIKHCKYSNRSPIFHQYQTILKPSPSNIQKLYLKSLNILGIDTLNNDIKFIEDNWTSPTLGASGIGWEVWLNGIEITQFTYFQQMGSITCHPIMVELAYGLERICMYIQNVIDINDIIYDKNNNTITKYKDVFNNYERDLKYYYIENININKLYDRFNDLENECNLILKKNITLIAYDILVELNYIFNLLDAKMYFSSTERQNYISKIRTLANKIAIQLKT